ncbi:hypothetical protein CPAR01_06665 [Colletotrichum paranaense]|uniref:Uncharacterized protein n=1 Tax=Colletotrichum paranaense TaxID=1914294 RepID=A0ABQ9SMD5_9PEZI|nr:uncharacterized protein CPAR01_06665 [Colletotrichum paranaense]KAK1540676.1 hypothetical protein CPAR01_06665 [Colletotrichum paranaense]
MHTNTSGPVTITNTTSPLLTVLSQSPIPGKSRSMQCDGMSWLPLGLHTSQLALVHNLSPGAIGAEEQAGALGRWDTSRVLPWAVRHASIPTSRASNARSSRTSPQGSASALTRTRPELETTKGTFRPELQPSSSLIVTSPWPFMNDIIRQ